MAIEIWGGVECTLNRVQDRYFDQVERSGHAHRLEDLDRFAALGLRALRYPLLWERVAPESLTRPDWQWTDERFARIRQLGMRPIAGLLHHGSGPRYTSLIDPNFPELLGQYASMVAERYPWIEDYTPVNEPLTTARFSGLYGVWYPHRRATRAFVRALLNQTWGTVLAMREIRKVNPAARLIQTEDCGRSFGTAVTRHQVDFENHRRWLTWDLLTGRVRATHPLWKFLLKNGASRDELELFVANPTPPQVIGLNYYLTSDRFLDDYVERYPQEYRGGNGKIRYADIEAVRRRREGLCGHEEKVIEAWRRYRLPVAITEVHIACTREEQMRWLLEAWKGARAAEACGAKVVAITPWALLGSYDWDSLVTNPRGHYESGVFDVRSHEPRPTALAPMIKQLATAPDEVTAHFAGTGWWRRPERMLHGHAAERRTSPHPQPLLILGGSGTLGHAFLRVAEARHLSTVSAGRNEVDINNLDSVRRLLQQVKPWAVVNATGYVRVDDAEQDSEACFGINTGAAVTIATACAEQRVPLVTYSSDLVFDGATDRPYTEHDVPHPLNVYGASKAEAERLILDIMPDALIVRTSAFFGPWDTSNFLVRALAAIRTGHTWRAASDIIVSPTYVPDLVNAAIDLLQDREHGIWHLSNEGPVSWYEFAQSAAIACGERTDLIEPAAARDLGWPAARPAYSALASVRGRVMRPTPEALAAFAASAG
ncbi:MAG TPA: dTDP-4-dehydrorhamnose reductase [Vicinamibacterales bacterium]|nr:dTDP-4-dehydrorhamnose reductase [Vicinamibacterales bacterium]